MPALWGLNSLRKNRVIIDCGNDCVYINHDDDVKISGGEAIKLEITKSGHYAVDMRVRDPKAQRWEKTAKDVMVSEEKGEKEKTEKDKEPAPSGVLLRVSVELKSGGQWYLPSGRSQTGPLFGKGQIFLVGRFHFSRSCRETSWGPVFCYIGLLRPVRSSVSSAVVWVGFG